MQKKEFKTLTNSMQTRFFNTNCMYERYIVCHIVE